MARRPGLRSRQKKKRRLPVLLAVVLVALVVVAWNMAGGDGVLQSLKAVFTSQSQLLKGKAEVRGILYDRNYKKLAESLERVSVYARTRELKSIEEVVKALSRVTGTDEQELTRKLKSGDLRVWLAMDINQQQEEEIKELELAGVYLHKEHSRYYPQNLVAAHLIGFVQDDIGLAGAEFYYDRLVQRMLSEADSGQLRIGAGQHVLLTLDLKIQEILEKLVERVAAGRQNVRIGAYAMDAGSGALVGAVQVPSFNPNTYRIYSQHVLRSLLVEPMLLPPLYRRLLRDSAEVQNQYESRGSVHPWSVSAGETSLGSELRLWERLGMNEPPPQDFGNNELRRGGASDLVILPGQTQSGLGTVPEQISPLILLKSLSALLNGGNKVEPHLAQAVVDPVDEQEYQLRPEAAEKDGATVVSPGVSDEIAALFSAVGKGDEFGGVTVSDTIHVNIRSGERYGYLSNELYFSALPYRRAGIAVVLTVQGGSREVPVKVQSKMVDPSHELALVMPRMAVLQQIGKSIAGVVEPEEDEVVNYPVELEKLRASVKQSLKEVQLEQPVAGDMPALIGLSVRKSLRLLQNAPCEIRVFGTGRVVAQSPAAGAPLAGVEECVIRLQRQADVSLEALEEKLSERE